MHYCMNPQGGGVVEVDLFPTFPKEVFLEVIGDAVGTNAVVALTPQEAEQLSVRLWEASVKAAQV